MKINEHIFNQVAGNIYWKNCHGTYLGCNDAFAQAHGFKTAAEIEGKNHHDLIKNQIYLDQIIKTDQLVIQTKKEHILEETGFDHLGNVVIYLTKKAPLRDENQNIIGVLGTSINITDHFDLKDHIIRHTTGNVYWKDLEGRYLGCNDSYAEMIGLSHPNEIISKNDRELFFGTLGEERLKALIDLDQTVMGLGIEKMIEEVGVDKNGSLAIYMTKKVPVRDEKNNIIGLVGNSLDITKQKQAELAKLEFLRNMSHDLMTPFTGIQGIASILYEEEVDADKKIHLKYLIQSSERLLQLFKQILEVSEFGGRQLKLELFNLKDLVTDTVAMVSASIRLKGLSLIIDAEDKKIKSDKLRVARILLNLLSNAIKFTNAGSIHIMAYEDENKGLTIHVKDSGTGIPEEKLEVIFEKFQKLSESGKHAHFMGSGIGLYIAKQFALELGGNIFVESELEKGSTFTFHAKCS